MKNFNHLYYFYIVAKLKSVTAAAKFLHTSQPSITTQIKTLEKNLHRSLFFKRGKYLELTAEGAKIYNYCARMFQIFEELQDYLHQEAHQNEIRIGFSSDISRPFISSLINEVLKTYKTKNRPQIKLICSSHESLIERLKTNRLDYALTSTFTNQFEMQILDEFEMPVVLVGTKALLDECDISHFRNQDQILKKVSSHLALPSENIRLRSETNVFLAYKRLNYSALIESDIISTLIQSTVEGITFAFLPKPYVFQELKNGTLKNISPQRTLWGHHLSLIGNGKDDDHKKLFIKKFINELNEIN